MSSSTDGEILIQRGWQQGVLVPAAGYSHLIAQTNGNWRAKFVAPSQPLEHWIVVSQDCDILSPAEPFVEVMACYWCERGSSPYSGSRAGNSYRYFFVSMNEYLGTRGAMVVDATRRAQVRKSSLIGVDPGRVEPDEPTFQRAFRQWLGGRYSRAPLPQDVVDTIQRPIVNGIKNLKRHDQEIREGQEMIREMRIYPLGDLPPYDVEMIMLIREDVDRYDENLSAFRGSIEMWLSEFPVAVRTVNITTMYASEMYVSEYEATVKLPLDHYSKGESVFDTRGPIPGIDHG